MIHNYCYSHISVSRIHFNIDIKCKLRMFLTSICYASHLPLLRILHIFIILIPLTRFELFKFIVFFDGFYSRWWRIGGGWLCCRCIRGGCFGVGHGSNVLVVAIANLRGRSLTGDFVVSVDARSTVDGRFRSSYHSETSSI